MRDRDCEKQIKALESQEREPAGVPDEILQRVFDDCCNMNHFVVDNPSRTAGSYQTDTCTGSQYCLFTVAEDGLAMPSIWSNISLLCVGQAVEEDYEDLDSDGILSTMDIFLNRGLQHPMTVIIELTDDFDNHYPALTLLIPHMHRWRSFTDRSRFYQKDYFLHTLTSPNFPLLEELEIADANEGDLDIFSSAPKLKKLSLDIIPSGSLELSVFSRLTHLELYCPRVYQIRELTDNSHLVTLKTDTDESYDSDFELEEVPPPTPCRTIETLILCYDPGSFSRSILLYLTLPSLKTMRLERGYRERRNEKIEPYMRESDWYNFDPFMAFLSRSSCTLTTFVDDSYVAPQCSPITGRFIESLQVRDDTRPIVPRLHSLKLNVGARSFGDGSVVDMVRSRWIPCKLLACASRELEPRVDCLREVTIRFRNREETKGAYESLEEIERDGMRAVVLWKNEGSGSELEE
ncbi:hypothetical protein BT96DRAFT_991058 [Gymnopus androsaceus JB14]|uniref:F-box domain-containing protein n=1 Tax=Gymnopus androsaceus JB14 TaxID=1447944 RepID=A0A6A4I070_9AGAR|nr:hypothetical protein BT96DRAFT_991058 [Gymnopus androsaceus JB14]